MKNDEIYCIFKSVNRMLYKLLEEQWLAVLSDNKIKQIVNSIRIKYCHIG